MSIRTIILEADHGRRQKAFRRKTLVFSGAVQRYPRLPDPCDSASSQRQHHFAGSGSITLLSSGETKDSAVNAESIAKLENLEQAISKHYYQADEVTQEQKEDGLYKGLLESLDDPYSVYYTKEEVAKLNDMLSGTYGGIGAYISLDETYNIASTVS